jgi:hypothetical protein
MIENETLLGLIGAWAKKHHPEKYEQTLRVATNPTVFRRYLLRLVELYVNEDRKRATELPVSVLDETSLVFNVRDKKTGRTLVFKGRRSDPPIENRTLELTLGDLEYADLQRWKETLDLEYVKE